MNEPIATPTSIITLPSEDRARLSRYEQLGAAEDAAGLRAAARFWMDSLYPVVEAYLLASIRDADDADVPAALRDLERLNDGAFRVSHFILAEPADSSLLPAWFLVYAGSLRTVLERQQAAGKTEV